MRYIFAHCLEMEIHHVGEIESGISPFVILSGKQSDYGKCPSLRIRVNIECRVHFLRDSGLAGGDEVSY